MTCTQIGNYGTNPADFESNASHVRGFVIKELANLQSNYRSDKKLDQWLHDQKILAIAGIDTRALTRKIRTHGALKGVISTDSTQSDAQLVQQAKDSQPLQGQNLAAQVSRKDTLTWDQGLGQWLPIQGQIKKEDRFHIVAIDCGAKLNILRNLTDQGCKVTLVPFDTTSENILKLNPDGIFVSNGPGDPAAVTQTIATLKKLIGKKPIFGICLGHQLLCLALGAKTYKMKFGHRGGNQPVQNIFTKKVEITSQNHGFAVDTQSLTAVGAEPTHFNLNDQTLAGFRHNQHPLFAIQYHPEASPGPHDSRYLFDCFIEMIKTGQSPTGQQMHQLQCARNTLA